MGGSSTIYLVRHAKAGERRTWELDDAERPLSAAGWKQAERVAGRLAKKATGDLVSSPYVRCVQTLEPLAQQLGRSVIVDDRLSEGASFEPVLEMIAAAPDGTVMCSHGDVIPAVVDALARRRMELLTSPDWRKSSVWVLKRSGSKVVKGKAWPPPS
jgi:8-oxo-dGTP diphosphatase